MRQAIYNHSVSPDNGGEWEGQTVDVLGVFEEMPEFLVELIGLGTPYHISLNGQDGIAHESELTFVGEEA